MLLIGGNCYLLEANTTYRRQMLLSGGKCYLPGANATYWRQLLLNGGKWYLWKANAIYWRQMLLIGGNFSRPQTNSTYRRQMLLTGDKCFLPEANATYRRHMLLTIGQCYLPEANVFAMVFTATFPSTVELSRIFFQCLCKLDIGQMLFFLIQLVCGLNPSIHTKQNQFVVSTLPSTLNIISLWSQSFHPH